MHDEERQPGPPQESSAPPPPPPPPADKRDIRFSTRIGAARRRLIRRVLFVPALLLALGVALFVTLGLIRPTADGPLMPEPLEALLDAAPGPLARLDPLQVLILPFLAIGLYLVVRGSRYARRTSRALLVVNANGRLVQTDGATEHVDLGHLLEVDVAPNRAFTDLNERTPVGSPLVLRLTDATGGVVDVNPGMWEHERALIDIVRHYAWHGRAAITTEAAERYRLPVRYRHGEVVPADGVGPDGSLPHTEDEREAALRRRGIDMHRAASRPDPAAGGGRGST